MVYDRASAEKILANQTGPRADFVRAELALVDTRLEKAASLMQSCLANMSSEDIAFRSHVNQQLHQVHRRLVRAGIRSADREKENGEAIPRQRRNS
jgi:hypothetical protein